MKIESESLIAEGRKAMALMRQKRESEVSLEGKVAANLVFHAVTLANCMRSIVLNDDEGQERIFSLVRECVKNGDGSELNRILAEMQK